MHPHLVKVRDEMIRVAREHGVTRLSLIGSARETSGPAWFEDVDLVVSFEEGLSRLDRARREISLREKLSPIVNRPVDLAELARLEDADLLEEISETEEVIYAT